MTRVIRVPRIIWYVPTRECLPVRGHEHAPFEMVPTDLLRDALALLRSQAEEIAVRKGRVDEYRG